MSKKTETIEIRLSPELKSALTEVSKRRGHSMSEEVRGLIAGATSGSVSQQTPGVHTMPNPISSALMRSAAFAIPIAALGAVYLLSSQSPAQAVPEARAIFLELDADADGLITRDDMAAFAAADDWSVDPACATGEAPEGEPCSLDAMITDHFQGADANGDGQILYSELEAIILRERAEIFLEWDFDENGFLDRDELVGMELSELVFDEELAAEIEAEEGYTLPAACSAQLRDGEDVGGLAEACGVADEFSIEMAYMDTDRDGVASLMEFLAH